jgi:hypothetical protein
MTQHEWEMMFDLMEKAISLPGLSADEKGQLIRARAREYSSDTVLDEFISMAILLED